jgi:hypothetical protein
MEQNSMTGLVAGSTALVVGVVGHRVLPSTQQADRARLAREHIGKLLNESGTSIPSPSGKVRAAKKINVSDI